MKHATYTELYAACRRTRVETLDELETEAILAKRPRQYRNSVHYGPDYIGAFYEVLHAILIEKEEKK